MSEINLKKPAWPVFASIVWAVTVSVGLYLFMGVYNENVETPAKSQPKVEAKAGDVVVTAGKVVQIGYYTLTLAKGSRAEEVRFYNFSAPEFEKLVCIGDTTEVEYKIPSHSREGDPPYYFLALTVKARDPRCLLDWESPR